MEDKVFEEGLNQLFPDETETPPTEQDPNEETTEVEEIVETEAPDTETDEPDKEPKTNPMRELRTQYDKTKRELEDARIAADRQAALLKRIAEERGVKVEELEEILQAEEDKKIAESRQIPVETQRQLREAEERIRQLEEANARTNFNLRAEKLQREFDLTELEMRKFAEQAYGAGIDILNSNVDLNILYRSLNFDTIAQTLREQERQAVLKEIETSRNASPETGKLKGKAKTTVKETDDTLTDADFINSVIQQITK